MVMNGPNRLQNKATRQVREIERRKLDSRSLNQDPEDGRKQAKTVTTSLKSLRDWFRSLDWSDNER
jgi:hypothetical protein